MKYLAVLALMPLQVIAQELPVESGPRRGSGVTVSPSGIVACVKRVTMSSKTVVIGGLEARLVKPCKVADGVEYYALPAGKYKHREIGRPVAGKAVAMCAYSWGVIQYRGHLAPELRFIEGELPKVMAFKTPLVLLSSGGAVIQGGKVVGLTREATSKESFCFPINQALPVINRRGVK